MAQQTSESGSTGLLTGRPGRVRAGVLRLLAESREIRTFSVQDEVRAALAESYAAAVDRATREADTSRLLQAGAKLVEVLELLPKGNDGGEEDPDVDDGDPRAKLYAVMDSPPALGDASHA